MEHVRGLLRPGMKESEVGALWEGYVHGAGTGYRGQVTLARGFSLVWSGPGIRTFTATGSRPVVEGQPTLFEIWVCCDGYWADHTKNLCPGELEPRYAELEETLTAVYDEAVASLPRRRRAGRARPDDPRAHRRRGLPGAAVASDLPRRRRPRARAALRPSGRRRRDARGHGARDRAGDLLARGRRPAPRGQLPRHEGRGREARRRSRTASSASRRSPRLGSSTTCAA